MSALAIGSALRPSTPQPTLEPISDRKEIVRIFEKYKNDSPTHYDFMKKWGLLRENNPKYEGNGNFGAVVRTRYVSKVAKCFTNPQSCRALREAKTLVFLYQEKIPHIPLLYAASPYRECPILILNHAGQDLANHYESGTLQLDDISIVAHQVLRSLRDLAEKGITHNDIKPTNICYDRDQHFTTLIDWEGASASGPNEPESLAVFTTSYKSPEECLQLKHANNVERCKTDVWAVAATIFSVLALDGNLVKKSDAGSRLSVLHAIEQRVARLPQKMIDASPLKTRFYKNNRLKACAITLHCPVNYAFEKGRGLAKEFFIPYDNHQYTRLSDLVLDLLKIVPTERPTAEEALAKHFPPRPSILDQSEEPLCENLKKNLFVGDPSSEQNKEERFKDPASGHDF